MNCTKCGNTLADGAAFCPNCGAPVQAAPAQAPTYAQPVAQQPVYTQPVPQQPVYGQPVPQQPVYGQPVPQQPVYGQPMPTLKKKSKAPWIILGVSSFLLIAIVALVIILVVSCSDDVNASPNDVVTTFLESIEANDAEACIETVYPAMLNMVEGGPVAAYTTLRDSALSDLDAKTLKFGNIKITSQKPMEKEDLAQGNAIYSSQKGYIAMTAGYNVEGTVITSIDGGAAQTIEFEATLVQCGDDYYLVDFDFDYEYEY